MQCAISGKNRHIHAAAGHAIGTMHHEILGWILQLGKHRSHVDLDLLSGTISHFDVVLTTHVILNILREVIAGDLDRLVGDDAAQRDHGDLGERRLCQRSCYPRSLHVEADSQSSRHRFKDHVYITSASMLCRVAYGTNLHFGTAGRDTDHHAQGWREEPPLFLLAILIIPQNHLLCR